MAGGEGGKKNDPTVPIVLGIGALLLLVLFGGCGNISLPSLGNYNGNGNGSGGGYSHPSRYNNDYCDPRHYDCRGHYERDGRWIPDDNGVRDRGHRSGHERRKPRPTDDPDPPGER